MIWLFKIGYIFGNFVGLRVQRFLFWIRWKFVNTLSKSDRLVEMELKRIIKKRKIKNVRGNRGRPGN